MSQSPKRLPKMVCITQTVVYVDDNKQARIIGNFKHWSPGAKAGGTSPSNVFVTQLVDERGNYLYDDEGNIK